MGGRRPGEHFWAAKPATTSTTCIYRYDDPNQVYDGQGPVHPLTNATGAVTASFKYDPFGRQVAGP